MNGRILCLVFVWALCFLSTPAGAEVKTFNQCVKDCTVDQVEGIGQEGADGKHFEHTYRLKVNCVGYFGGNDHLTAERFFVTGQYSPLSQLGWEKIWVLGPGSSERKNAIETSFRCGSDPWRSNSSCANTGTRPTHTSSSDPGYSTVYEVDWSLCHGAAAPISRGGRSKIADAVAAQPAKVSLPAPVIVSPASEEELPNFGPVKVEVKHPPRTGWFTDARFPDTVALTWYYLGPDNAPHSPEKKDVIAEITGVGEQSANRVIDAKHLAEGKWQIVAAFPPKSGSSQQREISEREFWIGSKVDSAKARATIIEPRDGSLHSDDPVQAFVRYESAGNPNKPKAPGASAPGTGTPSKLVVEVQWVRWDEKTDDWADMEFAVTREQAADANFNLWSAGEGKFRIRARGRTSAEFKRPWTPWTTYYVGEAGARLRPHLRDLGSLPRRGDGGAPIPGTRETVRKLRPPPAPSLTTRVSFNRVKIRLGGLLSAQEYGFEHARYSNGQWQGVNAKGYDRLRPPAKEISVPLTVYSAADKARVRVRAEKPNRGSWSAWKEFVPTPALRAPLRRPPSPAPGGSQQKLRKLLPRP